MMDIEIKNLSKRFGDKIILDDFSLSLKDGGLYGLTAPSGRGKTTLLRLLLGLLPPDAGSITPGVRYSAVFQTDRLLPNRTPVDQLLFVRGNRRNRDERNHPVGADAHIGPRPTEHPVGADAHIGPRPTEPPVGADAHIGPRPTEYPVGADAHIGPRPTEPPVGADAHIGPHLGRRDRDAARAFLTGLLPEESLDQPVGELSGGMQRRVAIARALWADSDAVLMDEPFTGLDETTLRHTADFILANLRARTLLLSTHQKELLESYPFNWLTLPPLL